MLRSRLGKRLLGSRLLCDRLRFTLRLRLFDLRRERLGLLLLRRVEQAGLHAPAHRQRAGVLVHDVDVEIVRFGQILLGHGGDHCDRPDAAAHAGLPHGVVGAGCRPERHEAGARRTLRAASIFGQSFWYGGLDKILRTEPGNLDVDHWLQLLIEGEILEVKFENPHVEIVMQNQSKKYTMTLAPVFRMENRGLPKASLPKGKRVKVEGYQSKVHDDEMRIERITVDGKVVELR